MQAFLTDHNLFSSANYCFQKKSSPIIQLTDCQSDWLIIQNGGKATYAIFLDYAKMTVHPTPSFHSNFMLMVSTMTYGDSLKTS